MRKDFIIGLDLGKEQDYTAWVVFEKRTIRVDTWSNPEEHEIGLIHLNQLPLGLSWKMVALEVRGLLAKLKQLNPSRISLWVDATGLGDAVIEGFISPVAREFSVALYPVRITGGDKGYDRQTGTVSKIHLIDNAIVMREKGEFKIARELKDTEVMRLLEEQIQNFQRIPSKRAGAFTYGALEGEHDDLILAFSLGCLGITEEKKHSVKIWRIF